MSEVFPYCNKANKVSLCLMTYGRAEFEFSDIHESYIIKFGSSCFPGQAIIQINVSCDWPVTWEHEMIALCYPLRVILVQHYFALVDV
jgi:hypothetical protein